MKIYLVGGAVRDKLLGRPVQEKDYVVVGSTVDEMLALGFKQVGKDFPVFLHPKTGEEYALARMERKVKPGYKGFVFDTNKTVSLEEDLKRRDLTINAMAETEEGDLKDFYGGEKDLAQKILRHVSPHFAEDPVRILRIARFLARYANMGFQIAPETMELMKDMVKQGEVDALVPERVWKELERALGEKNPEKFFEVLHECEALKVLFPELEENLAFPPALKTLIKARELTDNPLVRFAALLHFLPKEKILAITKRYRIPDNYQKIALLIATYFKIALEAEKLSLEELLTLLMKLDIFRRRARFELFLKACEAIAVPHFDSTYLRHAADTVSGVELNDLLAQKLTGQAFANALYEKRLKELEATLPKRKRSE